MKNKLAIVGHIKFEYTNWHGDNHEYDGRIESVEYESYPNRIAEPEIDNGPEWLMHVIVSFRDGDVGPGRRTFKMSGMRNVELRFAV
jgi:hypothetical protein